MWGSWVRVPSGSLPIAHDGDVDTEFFRELLLMLQVTSELSIGQVVMLISETGSSPVASLQYTLEDNLFIYSN